MLSRIGIALGLALSLILTSCAPPTPVPPSPAPTTPPATLTPTSEPTSLGVPVIDYANQKNELLVISSLTGKTLNALTPIPLGTSYFTAFAPDGRTLAVLSDGQLYLIDLPSWKYRASDVGMYGWMNSMVYSPDGTLLALAGAEPGGDLHIVDAKSGVVKATAHTGFSIRDLRFTAEGKAIMVYGPQLASSGDAANAGVSVGAPRATLLSVPDLSVLWSVALDGIRDGTFPKQPGIENTELIYQPGMAWHFQPGVAFDPNRDLLYLVHGDEDKLTTVDFIHRKVSTVAVHAQSSWLDRLMALTAGVAYAKGMDGTTKQALLSPDGKFLFVTGDTEAVILPTNDKDLQITDTPTGLEVIATGDGSLVSKLDTEATSAMLSPDGSQVLLTGWNNNDTYSTPWTDVYDIASRSIVKHLNGVALTPTRRLDGKVILVSSSTTSYNVSDMAAVNPDTWTVTGEWKGPDEFGWLLAP
jgi:hypothetical protein